MTDKRTPQERGNDGEILHIPLFQNLATQFDSSLSRRGFLTKAAALGVSIPVFATLLAACAEDDDDVDEPPAVDPDDDVDDTDDDTDVDDDDTADAPSGGTLLFNGGSNPTDLDPQTTGATVSWYVLDNIFDRLVRLDAESYDPVPSLAEDIQVSDDGLEFTFKLREGVLFHNGREMTSEDVKFSFERIMDPDVPAVAKPYFNDLDGIETPDDYTVVLRYNSIFAPLLIALARLECAIVPQEEVEQEDWQENLVGTGPFKFDSFVRDQAVVMLKNEDYWEPGLPKLDRVEQRVIVETETAVVNVRTGDIHVTPVEPKDIDVLEAEQGVNVEVLTSTNWPHLSVNCGREPFSDVRVRQAIRLGINREDIHQLAFFGTGLISNTLLPEGNPFRAEVEGWEYDPDRARELLEEAGYGDGFSAVLRAMPVPYITSSAQIIQENLAELNITVEIEQIESTTWFTEVFNNSEFDMTIVAHVSKLDPDLSMLDIMHSSPTFGTKNYTQLNDPELDELLEAGRSTLDMDERLEHYTEAQRVFVERSGYIVLVLQELVWAMRDNVRDFERLSTAELRWKNTWLDG